MEKTFLMICLCMGMKAVYGQQFISQKVYTTPLPETMLKKEIFYKNDGTEDYTTTSVYKGKPDYKIVITRKVGNKIVGTSVKYHKEDEIKKTQNELFELKIGEEKKDIGEETRFLATNGDSIIVSVEKIKNEPKIDRFGIFGYGNLNQENEKKINGSTKFSCYYIPIVSKTGKFKTILNLSFNKNATNTDTLLASTLLFPELGNAAFIGTIETQWRLGSKNNVSQFLSAFGEFSLKNIKAAVNDTNYTFDILSYTIGGRYAYNYEFKVKQGEEMVSRHATFSLIPYVHFTNIPNEDNGDYRAIFGQDDMPSVLFSWGVKVVAQYHHFGIFADFRNMTRNAAINDRDIKGFNSNIGVVVSAELIQF